MTPDEFLSALTEFDIQLSDKQIKQFERYFELLVEWRSEEHTSELQSQR